MECKVEGVNVRRERGRLEEGEKEKEVECEEGCGCKSEGGKCKRETRQTKC